MSPVLHADVYDHVMAEQSVVCGTDVLLVSLYLSMYAGCP